MKNKKLMYAVALSLSLLFSLLYFAAFHFYTPSSASTSTLVLYMNQIGLYKNNENAQKVKAELATSNIEAYIYKNEGLFALVSGLSTTRKGVDENGDALTGLSYSYLVKKVSIYDEDIAKEVKNKKYEKALEMIGNQSKRDAT